MNKPVDVHIDLTNLGSNIQVHELAIGAIINALRNYDPALGRAIGMHLRSSAAMMDREPVTGRLLDLAAVAEAGLEANSKGGV